MANTKLRIKDTSAMVVFHYESTLTDRQINNRLDKLSDLEEQIKLLKAKADAIKDEIKDAMTSDHISTTKYKVNYTTFDRVTVDTKRLKADLPEVAKQYEKVTSQTRFSYTLL